VGTAIERIGGSITEALQAPSKPRKSILHQDISPRNILVSGGVDVPIDEQSLKLTDFSGQELATPGYTPPERTTPMAAPGEGWDIYSLGAILSCLITGVDPDQTSKDRVDLGRLPKDIAPELTGLLLKRYVECTDRALTDPL
jgi:serine/threonine protein kinase